MPKILILEFLKIAVAFPLTTCETRQRSHIQGWLMMVFAKLQSNHICTPTFAGDPMRICSFATLVLLTSSTVFVQELTPFEQIDSDAAAAEQSAPMPALGMPQSSR